MGKNWRRGGYREFGRVWMVDWWEIGEFLVVKGVGSSKVEEIWKKWENVEEEWGNVLGYGEGVGDAGKYGGGVEKCMGWVWRLWGSGGKCVGMWGGVEKCVGKCGKSPHTLLHLSPHHPHSPDTSCHTPTLIQHLSPTSPALTWHFSPHFPTLTSLHSLTLPHTFPHIFPHFPPHPSPHSPHLTPSLTSTNTSPHSLPTLPHNPHASSKLSHTPHAVSFTPYQNFSLFSFIAKLV